MDSNNDLESDSDSGADITPLSDSETELKVSCKNSIRARVQALTLFKL